MDLWEKGPQGSYLARENNIYQIWSFLRVLTCLILATLIILIMLQAANTDLLTHLVPKAPNSEYLGLAGKNQTGRTPTSYLDGHHGLLAGLLPGQSPRKIGHFADFICNPGPKSPWKKFMGLHGIIYIDTKNSSSLYISGGCAYLINAINQGCFIPCSYTFIYKYMYGVVHRHAYIARLTFIAGCFYPLWWMCPGQDAGYPTERAILLAIFPSPFIKFIAICRSARPW